MSRTKSTISRPSARVTFVYASEKGGLLELLPGRRVAPSWHLHLERHRLQPDGDGTQGAPPKPVPHEFLTFRRQGIDLRCHLEDHLSAFVTSPQVPITPDAKRMVQQALHRPGSVLTRPTQRHLYRLQAGLFWQRQPWRRGPASRTGPALADTVVNNLLGGCSSRRKQPGRRRTDHP